MQNASNLMSPVKFLTHTRNKFDFRESQKTYEIQKKFK